MANRDHDWQDMIDKAGWWHGTCTAFYAESTHQDIAFEATGCEVAAPTWTPPIDCLHTECRIRRGELPPIALTEAVLDSERHAWLRWLPEAEYQKLRAAMIQVAEATGVYNPWDIPGGWRAIVGSAIRAS